MKCLITKALIKKFLFGALYILGSILFMYFFVLWLSEMRSTGLRANNFWHMNLPVVIMTFVVSVVFSLEYIKRVVWQIVKYRTIKIKFSRLILTLLLFPLQFPYLSTRLPAQIISYFWVIYGNILGIIIFNFVIWYNLIHIFIVPEKKHTTNTVI